MSRSLYAVVRFEYVLLSRIAYRTLIELLLGQGGTVNTAFLRACGISTVGNKKFNWFACNDAEDLLPKTSSYLLHDTFDRRPASSDENINYSIF